MIASTNLELQKRRVSKKFLGFLKRTFKDLVEIGDDLSLIKQEMTATEFREYLGEEFGGSKYLAQTAIAIASWFNGLSDRLKAHIFKAESIQTLTNWSLAALRELPKVGEETVRSLLKFGAVSVKKIRAAAGASPKPKKPTPGAEELEVALHEAWEKLHSLEVELDGAAADPLSVESLRLSLELANKNFARIAGRLGISVGAALRRVKGEDATISEEEINQRINLAIAHQRAEVEEVLSQTKIQAEREILLMQKRYAEENERLKKELQQIQEVLREKDLYKQRVEELERELEKAQQIEEVVKERIKPVLEQVAQLKGERDWLLAQLEEHQPQTVSEEEWTRIKERGAEVGLTVEEFGQLVLLPYGHRRGSQLLVSQLPEAWNRLEAYIARKSKFVHSNPPKKGMTFDSKEEAQAYCQKEYGSTSDRARQEGEVKKLKTQHPQKAELLNKMQKEALKYGLRLRDLIAEPFSVCVCTSDQQTILAKLSLNFFSNTLQAQQVLNGQLGQIMPVSSFSEFVTELQEVQAQQLEMF